MPYCVADSCSSGISSGRPSTIITPRIAVKEIEDAISSLLAPMIGATAAIAELPQMELPQAIRIESRVERPSRRLMPKETLSATTTTAAIDANSATPDAAMAAKLIEAPSSITATSSSCLALNAMPACQRGAGFQKLRSAIPSRIAITSAST
ncbi:hypothetical protein ACVWW2_003679 [Bradyrhizobium sp. LM4.3]